jgi:RHS repeat-associated protein
VWLGDLPVAEQGPGASQRYIAPDHLGAPHQITDPGRTTVWLWDHDPFGNGTPTGSFTYNLRFPGQYFDGETGLHYNGFRDYDPSTGRYVQSDPVGLIAGINTYIYAADSPVSHSDPNGTNLLSDVIRETLRKIVIDKSFGATVDDPINNSTKYLLAPVIESVFGEDQYGAEFLSQEIMRAAYGLPGVIADPFSLSSYFSDLLKGNQEAYDQIKREIEVQHDVIQEDLRNEIMQEDLRNQVPCQGLGGPGS